MQDPSHPDRKSEILRLEAENEQLRAELAQVRQAARYSQLVFENSLDSIVVTNDEGRYLAVNQAAVEQFGYSMEQFLTMSVFDIRTWPGTNVSPEDYAAYQERGHMVGEFRFLDAQGRKRISLYSAQRIGPGLHRSISRDITDQRARDERLRLLTQAVENANDGILITESEQIEEPGPKIVYVNEAFLRMTGFRREEVLGKTPRILQGPKTDRAALDRMRAALTAWTPIRMELVNYRKDGSEYCVDLSLFPVFGEEGGQTYWMGVQRDVTEQKVAERRITESLRVKDVLLREIHHRIKNNLQLVSSLLELQVSRTNEEVVQPFVLEAQNRIEAMALIHEHLYESDSLDGVSMHEFIGVLVENLFGTYRVSGLDCVVECDPVVVPLDMAVPLGLILNELVTNAIKHGFNFGGAGVVTVRLTRGAAHLVVEVADDGVGLPDDFSPRENSSLGLRLVELLTQQLTGTVSFDRADPGTRVSLRAPFPKTL